MKRILRFFTRLLVVVLLIVSFVFIAVSVKAVIPVFVDGSIDSVSINITAEATTVTAEATEETWYTTLEQYWNDLSSYYESVEQGLHIKDTLTTVKSTLDTINKYYDFYKEVNNRIDSYKNYNMDKLQRDVSYKLDNRYPEVHQVVRDSEYITDGKKESRSMSDSRMKEVVFNTFGTIDKVTKPSEASTKIIATNSIIEASNSEQYLKELKESVNDYNSDVADENSPGKAAQLTAQGIGMSNAIAVENLALDADRNRLLATGLLNENKKNEASTKMNTYVYTSIADNPTGLQKDDLRWKQ